MMKKGNYVSSLLVLLILGGFVLTACGTGAPASTSSNSQDTTTVSTTIDGQTLLQDRCTRCHTLERITSAHKTADEWQTTVVRMINKGAELNAQEQLTLVNYLSLNYR